MRSKICTVTICALLLIGIIYLTWAPQSGVTEGMSSAQREKKELKALVSRTMDGLETQLDTSEEKLDLILQGLLPVTNSKVKSIVKKLWSRHKQMMELQIVQNQMSIAASVSPLRDTNAYPITDPIRELMEECVLLGNTITATDAAMANLGSAGGFASTSTSSGFSGFGSSKDDDDDDSGGWFGSSKDDDDDDEDSGGWFGSKKDKKKKKKKKKDWF